MVLDLILVYVLYYIAAGAVWSSFSKRYQRRIIRQLGLIILVISIVLYWWTDRPAEITQASLLNWFFQ
jgi:sulfite exporter TauE/SafE